MSSRICMGAVMMLALTQAYAEEVADSVMNLNEVSVTAIKSIGRTIDEAEAVTVLNGGQMERMNIQSLKRVSDVAPNFFIPDYGSRMTSTVFMRGLGTRIDQPVVGLNVDNVPVLNKDNYDFDLDDVERIEVIRGPQSTLYGRNTLAGLINIYTISPMRYQGSRALLEYSTAESWKAAVSSYDKYSDKLGMGVAVGYSSTGGYFRNEYNGSKVGREQHGSLRWRTSWRPTAKISIDNVAYGSITRQSGYPYAPVSTGVINYNDTCYYKRFTLTDGLTVRYIGENYSVSGITSFQYINDDMTLDQDFTPEDYFTLSQRRHEWAVTQDVISKGRVGDNYEWLGGVFGFYKRGSFTVPVTFKEDGISNLIIANAPIPLQCRDESLLLMSRFSTPVWGVALYHQSNYEWNDWSFSAGLRLDYERTAMRWRSMCDTGFTATISTPMGDRHVTQEVAIDETTNLHDSYLNLLPKVSVSRELGDAGLVYISAAKGYKAGGYNTQMLSDVLQQQLKKAMMPNSEMTYNPAEMITYKPESSWNYEVGANLYASDYSLKLDMTAFYIDCRNQQLTVFPEGNTTGRMMINADTRSAGAECSLTWLPVSNLELVASYGFTDARFKRYKDDNGTLDYKGKKVPYAPRNTVFASASYKINVRERFLDAVGLNVNMKGAGPIYWDEKNTVRQLFYAQLGASVRFEWSKVSLDFWGENLTGCNFYTYYFVSIGNAFAQQGKPRRVGVTLRYNFQSK